MRVRVAVLLGRLAVLITAAAQAQTLSSTRPEQVGLAPDRLARLTNTLKADVDKGYGFFGPGLVKKAYVDSKLWNDYPSNAELVERLARLPLAHHGMVGTAMDYARFLQMLLNGGTLDGARILGPRTIAYMTSDHLGSAIATTPLYLPGPGFGFGLGFAVRKDADAVAEAARPLSRTAQEHDLRGDHPAGREVSGRRGALAIMTATSNPPEVRA